MMPRKVIAILGGGLVRDKTGSWRTTGFAEGDAFGAMGDRLRVLAGAFLYKQDTEREIIALGGKGQLASIPDAPTVARVIKGELEELGVPSEKILTEERSANTYEQLMALPELIRKHRWATVQLISNKWHLPRVKAMVDRDAELLRLYHSGAVILADAEAIVMENDPSWARKIKEAYASAAMQERIALEKRGIQDLIRGVYILSEKR